MADPNCAPESGSSFSPQCTAVPPRHEGLGDQFWDEPSRPTRRSGPSRSPALRSGGEIVDRAPVPLEIPEEIAEPTPIAPAGHRLACRGCGPDLPPQAVAPFSRGDRNDSHPSADATTSG
jgi:hypothetical protein